MVLICPWCLSISLLSPYGFIFKSLHYHREVSKHVSTTFLTLALTQAHRDDLKCNLQLFLLGGTCLPSSSVLSDPNPVPDAENRAEGALQERYDWSFLRTFALNNIKSYKSRSFFLHVLLSLFFPQTLASSNPVRRLPRPTLRLTRVPSVPPLPCGAAAGSCTCSVSSTPPCFPLWRASWTRWSGSGRTGMRRWVLLCVKERVFVFQRWGATS